MFPRRCGYRAGLPDGLPISREFSCKAPFNIFSTLMDRFFRRLETKLLRMINFLVDYFDGQQLRANTVYSNTDTFSLKYSVLHIALFRNSDIRNKHGKIYNIGSIFVYKSPINIPEMYFFLVI